MAEQSIEHDKTIVNWTQLQQLTDGLIAFLSYVQRSQTPTTIYFTFKIIELE